VIVVRSRDCFEVECQPRAVVYYWCLGLRGRAHNTHSLINSRASPTNFFSTSSSSPPLATCAAALHSFRSLSFRWPPMAIHHNTPRAASSPAQAARGLFAAPCVFLVLSAPPYIQEERSTCKKKKKTKEMLVRATAEANRKEKRRHAQHLEPLYSARRRHPRPTRPPSGLSLPRSRLDLPPARKELAVNRSSMGC
jgi:hypothetical protein